jgi:hypothetical protein
LTTDHPMTRTTARSWWAFASLLSLGAILGMAFGGIVDRSGAMTRRLAVASLALLLAACGSGPVCVDDALCRYDAQGDCIPPCATEGRP